MKVPSKMRPGHPYDAVYIRLHVLWVYLKYMSRGLSVRGKVEKQFTDPPILVGGCGRSGTTLLLSILSANPKLFAIPVETGIFCKAEPRALFVNWRYNMTFFYGRYFNDVPPTATRWCEKTPMNVCYFDEIIEKFDNRVKLIHIIRDGRDVVLSRHPTNESEYWVEPERWVEDVRHGLSFKGRDNVFTLKYEDLIVNSEKLAIELADFLELPDPKELIDWHQHTTVKRNRAWSGEVQPIFNDSVGKWKAPKYRERVAYFMKNKEAVALLEELGYPV